MKVKTDQKQLGSALAAGGVSAIAVAFLGGCFYPAIMEWMSPYPASWVHTSDSGISTTVLLEIGLVTAMFALPVTLALGIIGVPVFRLLVKRGYSNVAAYVGGGLIVAIAGAALIGAAHFLLADFLVDSDFWFAVLLIGISGPVAGITVWYVLQHPRGNDPRGSRF
jgi:hypothetical protein